MAEAIRCETHRISNHVLGPIETLLGARNHQVGGIQHVKQLKTIERTVEAIEHNLGKVLVL